MPSTLISEALTKSQDKAQTDLAGRKAWIPFVRPGRFTSMSGRVAVITAKEIDQIYQSYNPGILRSPLLLGHDTKGIDDRELYRSPLSYGIIQEVRYADYPRKSRKEPILEAFVSPCSEVACRWIAEGCVTNCSPSFYLPNSPYNPTPGVFYLRHIALLGRDAPAITGLPPIHFSSPLGDIESGTLDGITAFSIDPDFSMDTGKAAFFDLNTQDFSQSDDLAETPTPSHKNPIREFFQGIRAFMITERGLEETERILPQSKIAQISEQVPFVDTGWHIGQKPHTLAQLYETITSPPFDWIGRCLRRPLLILGQQGSGKTGIAEFIAGCRVLFFGDTVSVADPHAEKNRWERLFPEVVGAENNFEEYEAAIARAMERYSSHNEPRHTSIWNEVTKALTHCDRDKFRSFLIASATDSRKAYEDPIFIAHESNFDDLGDSESFRELMRRGLVTIERFADSDIHGERYPSSRCRTIGLGEDVAAQEECLIAEWMHGFCLQEMFGEDILRRSVPAWSSHLSDEPGEANLSRPDPASLALEYAITKTHPSFEEQLLELSRKVESDSNGSSGGSKSKKSKKKRRRSPDSDSSGSTSSDTDSVDDDDEDDENVDDTEENLQENFMSQDDKALALQRKVEELNRKNAELASTLQQQSSQYEKLATQRKRERAVAFAQQQIEKGIMPKDALNERTFEFSSQEGVPTQDRMSVVDFMESLEDRQLSYFESFISGLETRDMALYREVTSGASPLSGRSPQSHDFSQASNETDSDQYSQSSNALHFAAMRLLAQNTGLSYEQAIVQLGSRVPS